VIFFYNNDKRLATYVIAVEMVIEKYATSGVVLTLLVWWMSCHRNERSGKNTNNIIANGCMQVTH
jgi:hypothetical protein